MGGQGDQVEQCEDLGVRQQPLGNSGGSKCRTQAWQCPAKTSEFSPVPEGFCVPDHRPTPGTSMGLLGTLTFLAPPLLRVSAWHLQASSCNLPHVSILIPAGK